MSQPISEIRDLYGELTGDSLVAAPATRQFVPLSARDLGRSMRTRSTVIVPVGVGLRLAAWIGLVLAAATAYGRPWVVDALVHVDSFVADWAMFFLDRGEPWTVAAGVTTCLGFVGMVFTNCGFRAEQFGMFALLLTATAGTVLGAPTLIALLIGATYITVVVGAVLTIGAMLGAGLGSSLSGN